ncbi:unnamed protein product, partial [Ixodes hexagonus]
SSKPWDQPLTTEDMRNRASSWSLADDSQLLAYLECISRNITSRSYEIQKELDSLIHQTRGSGVKVNNVINDFNHLSSLQFIENRVYDEEAKEPEKTQSEAQADVSKEQQEADLVQRMREAFQLGVGVVRSSLEFVDLRGDSEDEDSEDEGVGPRPPELLFRSRDPYLHRPLPLLIGSQAFVQDDRVGLGELLSDDEEEEKSSRGEYESDRSESDFDVEKEDKAPADDRMARAMRQEYGNHVEGSEEELFDQKAELHSRSSDSEPSSDDEDLLAPEKPPKRGSVSSKRSEGAGSVRRGEEDVFGVPSNGEMFAEVEERSPFKKRGGAFSGPGKLFDDDDLEANASFLQGDLFADTPPPLPKERAPSVSNRVTPQFTQSGKKVPAGAVSMLGGSGPPPLMPTDTRTPERTEGTSHAHAAAKPKLPPRAPTVSYSVACASLSEEENAFFKEPPKVVSRQQSTKDERPTSAALSSNSLFDSQASKGSASRFQLRSLGGSVGAKSGWHGRHRFIGVQAACNMNSATFIISTSTASASEMGAIAAVAKFPAGGLFDDDDDEDDLWAPITTKEPPHPTKEKEASSETQVPKPGGLFEDDDDLLFAPSQNAQRAETKPAKSFLFDDAEDDIFSSAFPGPEAAKAVESEPSLFSGESSQVSAPGILPGRGRAASKGLFLFEDDVPAENKLPQAKKEPEPEPVAPKKPTRKSISLFDEEEADEDLFVDRTPPAHMADSQSSHSIQSSSWSTGSKGDAEPASVQGETAPEQVGKARSGSRFLFEQEDDLFRGIADEGLDVDLFAPPKSGPPPAISTNQKKPVGGVSPFSGSSLFGDELKNRLGKVGGVLEEPETDTPEDGSGSLFAAKPKVRPPLRDTKVASVSFDEPADQTKTLTSTTKDRAKIQTKRRPPSRKGRQPKSGDDVSSDLDSGNSPSTAVLKSPPLSPPTHHFAVAAPTSAKDRPASTKDSLVPAKPSMVKSPSTEEEDLFSVVENSLRPIPEARHSRVLRSERTRPQEAPFKNIFDDGEDDLFASANHTTRTTPSRPKTLLEDARGSDALFGSGEENGPSNEEVKALLRNSPKKAAGGIFDDDDTDIFKSSSRTLLSRPKRSTLFDDDDSDDIFGTKPVVPKASTAEKKSAPPVKKTLPKVADFKDPLLSELDD